MTLGNKIAQLRRKHSLTQEALAKTLGVTNQAVSKWESNQSCPDIALLPQIADLFGVTLDELFGRESPAPAPSAQPDLPWADDGTLRVVLYAGHQLIGGHPAADEIHFCYEGPALNIHSELSVYCDDVAGNVTAGGEVNCDDVGGDVHSDADVTCDEVHGSVTAGGNVTCDEISDGEIRAGGDVQCDHADCCTFTAGGDAHVDEADCCTIINYGKAGK